MAMADSTSALLLVISSSLHLAASSSASDSVTTKWSHHTIFLWQLRNIGRIDLTTVLHFTEKVIALDEQQVVAFIDPWRGMIICNVRDVVACKTPPASYLPLPSELINNDRSYSSSFSRDIAIVNGNLTVVRLRRCFDSDTDCWSWDLSTWSKPVARLDDSDEAWNKGSMVDSDEILVDRKTGNVDLLPKLEVRPAMARLQVANPTLSLTDANVIYVMGKVDVSDEKAVVLTVDIATKRLQTVSVYDAERIIENLIMPKHNHLKRQGEFHMQFPHKWQCKIISRKPLQLDAGSDTESIDETEDTDNPMDLD
uniref:DUF1618 domain-containing protein n=1 Tax=Leersia perrieri TaxID=77586 RepID=A0A0D9XGN0_9ORYZ